MTLGNAPDANTSWTGNRSDNEPPGRPSRVSRGGRRRSRRWPPATAFLRRAHVTVSDQTPEQASSSDPLPRTSVSRITTSGSFPPTGCSQMAIRPRGASVRPRPQGLVLLRSQWTSVADPAREAERGHDPDAERQPARGRGRLGDRASGGDGQALSVVDGYGLPDRGSQLTIATKTKGGHHRMPIRPGTTESA